jgi:2-iminobutanoate/2-iminopropanoate deaminase
MTNIQNIEVIKTAKAPQAIGPYSQAVRLQNLIFCSGQIPLNPNTGELVSEGIRDQTHQVLKNLKSVLEAAKTDLKHVLKTTVFLTNLQHFNDLNEVYGEYFQGVFPARSTIQVAALPRGAMVEIEAIAVIPER